MWTFVWAACVPPAPAPSEPTLAYPVARRDETVVDDFHGTPVADPYRWLEDPGSDETRAWIEQENALTESWLGAAPERDAIRQSLRQRWTFERMSAPTVRGGAYFFLYNDGTMKQDVLYRAASLDGPREVVLDPNTWSADGTVSLAERDLSPDGRWLVWAASDGGSDWRTVRVRDLSTGVDLPDVIEWVKFSDLAFAGDGSGFFYCRYPAPTAALEGVNKHHAVYWHRIGTAADQDLLVLDAPDEPDRGFMAQVTPDGAWLLVQRWLDSGDVYSYRLARLDGGGWRPGTPFLSAFDGHEGDWRYVDHDGDTITWMTDVEAPRGRIVTVPADAGDDPSRWRTIVPESERTMTAAFALGDRIVLHELVDARSSVSFVTRDGARTAVGLPGLGTATFDAEPAEAATWFRFASFTEPDTVLRLDAAGGDPVVEFRPKVDLDPSKYLTEQVFYTAKDGTRVPMFVMRRADLPPGPHPTLLYGYGGFNASLSPSFRVYRSTWMDMGGVWAVANLRGGGEYGATWHEAGMLERKQTVFDDFYAAAEWLIAEQVTDRDHLAIMGGSNGGLLVGAALTQRPDLFAVAVPQVGVMDMLRYHQFTIGWAWAGEYGRADDAEMFPVLYAYSPYHNLEPGTSYPATLVVTADHDDRVVPAHSYKFTAALQHAQAGPAPTLIRVDTRAGHGAGKSVDALVEEWTDVLTFLARTTGAGAPAP